MEDLRKTAGRVMMMVARGIIRAVGDGSDLQTLRATFLADEAKDGMERVQEYGFTSVPLPGSDCVAVFVGGNRAHGIVVATDNREHRPKDLGLGEVMIWDHHGNRVHLSEDGIRCFSESKVVVEAPVIEVTGDVSITGDVSVSGDLVAGGISLRDHIHDENDSGGPTEPPLGAEN